MKPVCVFVCLDLLSKIQYPSAQPRVHCSHISWVSLMPDWSEFRAKYQLICLTLSKSPALSCSLISALPPSPLFFFLQFLSLSLPVLFIFTLAWHLDWTQEIKVVATHSRWIRADLLRHGRASHGPEFCSLAHHPSSTPENMTEEEDKV